MDKEKLSLAITIGVSAAVHLKKDKRFADVKPLVPIVDGLLGSDDPKLITITAVGESNEPYAVVFTTVSYTHLRAHETQIQLVCRLLLEK